MKNLKKLTREQKKFLDKKKLNAADFMLERATPDKYVFYDKKKDLLMEIDR